MSQEGSKDQTPVPTTNMAVMKKNSDNAPFTSDVQGSDTHILGCSRGTHNQITKNSGLASSTTPNRLFQSFPSQLDGQQDYQPRMVPSTPASTNHTRGPPTNTRQKKIPKTAYHNLLPYCTVEMPLNEQQVIGLSDVAGSLKEVMLLAMRARTNEQYAMHLGDAVGAQALGGVVDFFTDEFEI